MAALAAAAAAAAAAMAARAAFLAGGALCLLALLGLLSAAEGSAFEAYVVVYKKATAQKLKDGEEITVAFSLWNAGTRYGWWLAGTVM